MFISPSLYCCDQQGCHRGHKITGSDKITDKIMKEIMDEIMDTIYRIPTTDKITDKIMGEIIDIIGSPPDKSCS